MSEPRQSKYAAAIEWLDRHDEGGSIRTLSKLLRVEFPSIKQGAAYHLVRDYRNGDLTATSTITPIPSASKHDAYYRKHDQQYVFVFNLGKSRKKLGKVAQFDMPVREVQFAVESYVHAGAGMSQKQVCRALSQRFERKMTADYFKYFLAALGIDKNSLPVAPHRYNEEADDSIISTWREQQEANIEVKKRSTDPEYWKERAHELKSALVDVEMFLERLPPVEVYSVDTPPRLWGTGEDDYQLVFAISDWHVGAHADLEKVAQRLVVAFDTALAAMSCLSIDAEKMPITLLIGGDQLDSVFGNMHPQQQSHQWSHGANQVSSLVSQTCTLIRYLFDLTSHPINVWSVPGNHDRTASDRKGDPDRILHEIIARWIASECKGIANFHTPERGHSILTGRLGHRTQLILYHGDTQPKDWRRTLLMHMDKSATHYLLVCGHRHTPEVRILEDLNVMVYQIGSPKAGLDRYAPDVIGVDSRPSQQILLIGPHGPQLPGQVFL